MRYVLPGMGATSAMYAGAWRTLAGTTFIDWPNPSNDATLASVSASLIERHGIGPSDDLIGSSLGGVVALEIAELVGTKHVGLVGSARRREEINAFLLALAPLANVTPLRLVQALAGKSGGALGAMLAEVDPAFIRSACREMAAWTAPACIRTTIHRIHGEHDHVIPCPPDATVIRGGGHLIAMTHADECVEFVRRTRRDR